MASLENKVIWITGASSGIGQALAYVCASFGAELILSARRMDELERVKQSLDYAQRHICIELDITCEKSVQKAHERVIQEKKKIDWLVNNAGIGQRSLVSETTMETERKIMEVDYFGHVLLTKTVLPTFLAQKSGRIVFISSVAGLIGTQYRATYSAAKAAIHMWANGLRAEVSDQNIHVSVVFPGFVKTKFDVNALSGGGQLHGKQDDVIQNGLDAHKFATKVVSEIQKGKEFIVVGAQKEKFGVLLSKISPSTLYKVIRKATVK